MVDSVQKTLTRAPGPSEPFDINVDDDTFLKLSEWVGCYGDLIQVKPVTRRHDAFILNHPDLIKRVLISNHKNYAKGVGFERVKMLLGNGIIVSDGDFWRSQRRMIQPAFHRQVIEQLSTMMQRCNAEQLLKWQAKAVRAEPIDLTQEMSELALEVVLRALFSCDLDALIAAEGHNPFDLLTDDFTRDLKLAMRFRGLTRHVENMMAARRAEQREEFDFLSMLMATRDKDTGAAMPDKALIDEVMTIIVAGHETTAGTLNWIWYLLSQHPEAEARLHAEVDALPASPTFADLDNLAYTRQIADEALRLYPPVWLYSRKAIDDDQLGDVTIPAGSNIFLCPYFLHRDARFWDEPETFYPERFSADQVKARHRSVYFPFSLGSRRCIGEFFSIVDMQLHVGLIARHLRLVPTQDVAIELEPHINLRTKHSITMLAETRHS